MAQGRTRSARETTAIKKLDQSGVDRYRATANEDLHNNTGTLLNNLADYLMPHRLKGVEIDNNDNISNLDKIDFTQTDNFKELQRAISAAQTEQKAIWQENRPRRGRKLSTDKKEAGKIARKITTAIEESETKISRIAKTIEKLDSRQTTLDKQEARNLAFLEKGKPELATDELGIDMLLVSQFMKRGNLDSGTTILDRDPANGQITNIDSVDFSNPQNLQELITSIEKAIIFEASDQNRSSVTDTYKGALKQAETYKQEATKYNKLADEHNTSQPSEETPTAPTVVTNVGADVDFTTEAEAEQNSDPNPVTTTMTPPAQTTAPATTPATEEQAEITNEESEEAVLTLEETTNGAGDITAIAATTAAAVTAAPVAPPPTATTPTSTEYEQRIAALEQRIKDLEAEQAAPSVIQREFRAVAPAQQAAEQKPVDPQSTNPALRDIGEDRVYETQSQHGRFNMEHNKTDPLMIFKKIQAEETFIMGADDTAVLRADSFGSDLQILHVEQRGGGHLILSIKDDEHVDWDTFQKNDNGVVLNIESENGGLRTIQISGISIDDISMVKERNIHTTLDSSGNGTGHIANIGKLSDGFDKYALDNNSFGAKIDQAIASSGPKEQGDLVNSFAKATNPIGPHMDDTVTNDAKVGFIPTFAA